MGWLAWTFIGAGNNIAVKILFILAAAFVAFFVRRAPNRNDPALRTTFLGAQMFVGTFVLWGLLSVVGIKTSLEDQVERDAVAAQMDRDRWPVVETRWKALCPENGLYSRSLTPQEAIKTIGKPSRDRWETTDLRDLYWASGMSASAQTGTTMGVGIKFKGNDEARWECYRTVVTTK